MSLKEFLGTDANLHFREELFNHRLLYDLKLATIATRGYALLTYTSDVDHDGFDVVLDDRDNLKKIQLKASGRWTKTESWDVHRTIIRPNPLVMEQLGFEASPNWGVGGGVILIDFDVDDNSSSVDVKYSFADIYTITAVALKMLPRHPKTVEAALNLRADLFNKRSNDKIAVSEKMFVPALNAQHLLALIGLHSGVHGGDWRTAVLRAASGTWEPATKTTPEETANLITNFVGTMKLACGLEHP
jgi:hypothetical protein